VSEQQKTKIPKICFVSSSGGHYLQLLKLKPLAEKYDGFFVSEKTRFKFHDHANYLMLQTDLKDPLMAFKMLWNAFYSLFIWFKEKPDFVVTTGTMIALPFCLLCHFSKNKKFVYIESFSRIYDGTKAGKFMYKYADLFLIQWQTLKKIYPKAVYGGKLY